MYNPHKPNKFHFKVYGLNCSTTGYLFSFYLYRGVREVRSQNILASNYHVHELTKNEYIHNKNYVLITDNYFTSAESILRMRNIGIYQFGTMKVNKLGTAKH